MPAATTHVEFGNDFLSAIPKSMREKVTDMPMFWIGTQGPDILFFSRMSIIPGSLHKYGNLLHEEKTREQFQFLTDYVIHHPHLESYLVGYICHYALDAKAHRLICSIADELHDKTGLPSGPMHVRMESEIDAWITTQKGRKTYPDIWKAMRLSDEDRKRLAILYHDMFSRVYGIQIPSSRFQNALLELGVWTPIIRPRYIGQKITLGGEFFLSSPKNTKNMIFNPGLPKEGLNLNHHAIPCFYDKNEVIDKSFPDLYDESLILAYKMIRDFKPEILDRNFMGQPLEDLKQE